MKAFFGILLATCSLFCSAQSTLEFSQVLLVSNNSTVPSGKVWKVESVPSTNALIPSTGTGGDNNYSISKNILLNGQNIVISRSARHTRSYSAYNSEAETDLGIDAVTELPLWLPAGTTVAPGTNATYISIIEFNIVP